MHLSLAGRNLPDCHSESWAAVDMFQQKINKIFKDLLNVFGIADGRDHDSTLRQVIQICCQENSTLYKNNVISGAQRCCSLKKWFLKKEWNQELCVLPEMPHKEHKGITIILGIMNYLGKFLPLTKKVCVPLHKLTSSKCD